MLLRAGANPNQLTSKQKPILIRVVKDQDCHLTELLLKSGADVNMIDDKWRQSALHHSAEKGLQDITKMLLAAGAKVNMQDRHGCIPLYLALCNSKMDVVDLLIGDSDLSLRCSAETALFIAVDWCERLDLQETLEKLIEKGADRNGRDFNNRTVLAYSCHELDVDATEALIKVGCDVNALCTDGLNILMEIPQTVGNEAKARKDMVTLMQMVIEAGASVEWDSSKNNPLTAALAHGNPACLRELLLVNCPTKMVRKGTLLSDRADRDDAIWHMTSWTTNKPEFDFVKYLFPPDRLKSILSMYRPSGGYSSRRNRIGSNRTNVAKSSVRPGFEYTFSL